MRGFQKGKGYQSLLYVRFDYVLDVSSLTEKPKKKNFLYPYVWEVIRNSKKKYLKKK